MTLEELVRQLLLGGKKLLSKQNVLQTGLGHFFIRHPAPIFEAASNLRSGFIIFSNEQQIESYYNNNNKHQRPKMEQSQTVKNIISRDELSVLLKENGDEWRLGKHDASTSREQTLEDEWERLLVLKSYNILESKPELELELLTDEARVAFDVPIAVVSLVDFGRQWFASIKGLDAVETPRSRSFCAHVVQRKEEAGLFVIRDATKDERFCDNPLVTGGPGIRFYAGAPLKSPEGAVLGSFCIIDTEPRPQGLRPHEEDRLQILAYQAVLAMITRVDIACPLQTKQ